MSISLNKIATKLLTIMAWLAVCLLPFSNVLAATDADRSAIIGDTAYYDPNATCDSGGSSGVSIAPGPIWIVGDSISVRIKSQLAKQLTAKDWKPKFNGVVGRNLHDSFAAITQDQAFIKTAVAVVVELGTNPSGNFDSDLKSYVQKLHALNRSATIFWANLASNKPGDKNYLATLSSENQSIIKDAGTSNYQMIDWFRTVFPNDDPTNMDQTMVDQSHYLDASDGLNVHPTVPAGIDAYSDLIMASLASSSGGGGCCEGGNFSGSNNIQIGFNYFVGQGLSGERSAGIVGNFIIESGVDPKAVQRGGNGRGIAQWDVRNRWQNLLDLGKAQGRDPLTLDLQLDFVWFELTGEPPTQGVSGGGSEKGAYDALLHGPNTVKDAAEIFAAHYERPASHDYSNRVAAAQEVFAKYSGGGGSGGGCSGLGSAGPFSAFPQNTTKKAIKAGSSNGSGTLVWCYTSNVSCHHDYNAADIFNQPGTVVTAALSGKVVSATESIGGVGSRVQILAADGKHINYYAHLAFGSLTVKDGQDVKASQPIGKVGDSGQAEGTAPHLHIDLLPNPPYDHRPDCISGACSKYPFIDIQPYLKQLYDTLVPEG